jgi:uncharacterized membrane protein YfcA
MLPAPSPGLVAAVVAVVAVAGAVNGVAGFGFAVVGTMALAAALDPATAVAFMILPMFAVNLALVGELSAADLRRCGRRFAPLLVATLVGTAVGTALLDRLPAAPLRVALGLVSLGFVATAQRAVTLPALGSRGAAAGDGGPLNGGPALDGVVAMAVVGVVSGALFGATNVGVQLVAYLRRFDLRHGLFVGVVALVFVGVNGLRVGAAAAVGLYPDARFAAASAAAAVPAVVGVAVGTRLRDRVTERARRGVVLGLLAAIGVRLVLGGAGVL